MWPYWARPVRCEVNDAKLITEEMALRLAQKAQEIVVPAGVIITPAAWTY